MSSTEIPRKRRKFSSEKSVTNENQHKNHFRFARWHNFCCRFLRAHISMVKSVILQNWVKNVKKFPSGKQQQAGNKAKDTVLVWKLL